MILIFVTEPKLMSPGLAAWSTVRRISFPIKSYNQITQQ